MTAGTDIITARVGPLLDTAAVQWLAVAPQLTITAPPDGTAFPPDSVQLITGQALPGAPHAPLATVTVNGQPVDVLDDAGRFFNQVTIRAGSNTYTFRLAVRPRPLSIPVGAQWGPCDLTGVDQPGWWGCDGETGIGLACARPVSDIGLNICVPQTADPLVDDDCGNLTAPFGLGVSTIGNGSAYCGVDCVSDADCAGGMACSPASQICAYIGQ